MKGIIPAVLIATSFVLAEEPTNVVPEFTTIGAGIAIAGAAFYSYLKSKVIQKNL